MKHRLSFGQVVALVLSMATGSFAGAFRPPAVPLVSVDPFFSIWSAASKLTDVETTHWAGAIQPMSAQLIVDGQAYRLIGAMPDRIPALAQVSTVVRPTQTLCRFANEKVEAELIFSTPSMPEDLDVFSRPVTYVTFRARMKDGQPHALRFAYRIGGSFATNDDRDLIAAETMPIGGGLTAMRLGKTIQKPLSRSGDRVRCDWGYAWLAAPTGAVFTAENAKACVAVQQGIGFTRDFGTTRKAETHCLLAYDDIDSVMFFGRPLKAWWRRNGLAFEAMLAAAETDYPALMKKMAAFDEELMRDLERVGGKPYATLAALAYRQSFAACKLVADPNGQPLYFSKENASNGCIGTVDVLYPQFPLLVLMSPTLSRATLAPILLYASDARWQFPFAPHDIGQYPLGNGQVYGGGERDVHDQMPVEETGNMLICLGALSQIEGNADFAGAWWPTVTKWAAFLATKGFDPENQLCTDDFAGHLAHNANLSIKAIMGLAAYAKMAELRGENEAAAHYDSLSRNMVPKWMAAAAGGTNGAYRLAFDKPGTWSMKYNLVWDRILGFNLFPREIARKEMAAYRKLQQPFGLPLDNRKAWTKADWLVWTATLTNDRDDFEALVERLYRYADETPDRIPFSDWYWADQGKFRSFIARSVIGGVFLPMLYRDSIWRKYAGRDHATTHLYAPLLSKNPLAAKPLNLGTFNIRCPIDKGENTWAKRLPRCVSLLKAHGFDAVGLQEATPLQIQDLTAAMPGWKAVGEYREGKGKGESSAVFFNTARFDLLGTDTFWLSEQPRQVGSKSWGTACTRVCTWAHLRDKATGRIFYFFNTHLDHISALARRNGMALILKTLENLAQGTTVILTGDLNQDVKAAAHIRRELVKLNGPSLTARQDLDPIVLAKSVLFDSLERSQRPHEGPVKTFTGYQPEARVRLDYLFTSGDVQILRHVTCADRLNGQHPSDHDPVFVQVE